MNIGIVYSTLTGNSKKLADFIFENYQKKCDAPVDIRHLDENALKAYDTLILCYWCKRGTADPLTVNLIQKLSGKKLIMIGTLGAYPDSPHGSKLKVNIRELVQTANTLLGNFTCQGKIDPARTEKRLLIPKGEPHHLDEEGYKRHLESRRHPDEADMQNALLSVHKALSGEPA